MTILALIRHGATAWNGEGRIQGRADIPLSPEGVAELGALRPPAELGGAIWLASPLSRTRQTAALLGGPGAAVEPLLIETDWGAWEGLTSAVIAPLAARLAARGRSGLDLAPPHGESPRDVQQRLRRLCADLARSGRLHVGVTHKGVIRAMLSLATGWDMEDKPPVKLAWRAAHLFAIAPDGSVSLIRPNLMLERRT
ncbi:histidine phosphatase family protein [Albidovulum sp.]|jgi:probable phosphoglycerate mutase|uniref:histidine phosphatase family protein n=1 Tax=Albidovulum sp. TaxID=1872424 RepID=UPI0039B91AA5